MRVQPLATNTLHTVHSSCFKCQAAEDVAAEVVLKPQRVRSRLMCVCLFPPAVRHATAAYQALSQGVASKRRTKSFDMAALPSVPEMNDSNIPSRTSQEVGVLGVLQHPVSSAFPVLLAVIAMSCHVMHSKFEQQVASIHDVQMEACLTWEHWWTTEPGGADGRHRQLGLQCRQRGDRRPGLAGGGRSPASVGAVRAAAVAHAVGLQRRDGGQ